MLFKTCEFLILWIPKPTNFEIRTSGLKISISCVNQYIEFSQEVSNIKKLMLWVLWNFMENSWKLHAVHAMLPKCFLWHGIHKWYLNSFHTHWNGMRHTVMNPCSLTQVQYKVQGYRMVGNFASKKLMSNWFYFMHICTKKDCTKGLITGIHYLCKQWLRNETVNSLHLLQELVDILCVFTCSETC